MTPKSTDTSVADSKLLAGCNKHFLGLATVTVGGTALPPAAVLANVQSRITAQATLDAATVAFHKAVTNNNGTHTQTHQFMLDLRAAIRVMFGTDAVALADFGLEPPKPKTESPATRVAAAQKAAATRKARGTKGKKQKLAITAPAPAAEPATPPAPAGTPTTTK